MTVAIPVPFNPANYTSTTNAEGFVLGGQYSFHGVVNSGVYRFCKNIDAVSISAGMGACFCDVTLPITDVSVLGRVTVDRVGGSQTSFAPAGVYNGTNVIAQNSFFFLLRDGIYGAAIDVGTSIGTGATVMADTTNDGKLITLSGSKGSFGVALHASSGNVFPIKVLC